MPRKIQQFIEFGEETGIVGKIARRGCSTDEIQKLEEIYSLNLPNSYREYLATMGHQSSLLFRGDHTDASYATAMWLATDLTSHMKEEYPEVAFSYPENSVFFAERLGAVFYYFRCDNSEDSPVWSIAESSFEEYLVCDSFVEWLFDWGYNALDYLTK